MIEINGECDNAKEREGIVPPEVRTPRFRARPLREITSPCFPHLPALSTLSYFVDFIVLKVQRHVYGIVLLRKYSPLSFFSFCVHSLSCIMIFEIPRVKIHSENL